MVMTFIADSGYQVTLSSIDLAEWAGNPADVQNIGSIEIWAGSTSPWVTSPSTT
jgi:hypothetical protein